MWQKLMILFFNCKNLQLAELNVTQKYIIKQKCVTSKKYGKSFVFVFDFSRNKSVYF